MSAVPERDVNAWDACIAAIGWLEAVEDMAVRSEEMHRHAEGFDEALRNPDLDMKTREDLHRKLFLFHRRAFSADHFFLEAARNASRWLGFLGKLDVEGSGEIDGFQKTAPMVKAVRDMREHADLYVQGKGIRSDFEVDFLTGDGLEGRIDATSTERRAGDVIYGGRVSREAVRAASGVALAYLHARLTQYENEDRGGL